jgi:hypothetical protein
MMELEQKYKTEKRIISEIECAIFASTDPAYSLQYTLAGIISVRSLLMSMMSDGLPDSIAIGNLLNNLTKTAISKWNVAQSLTDEENDELLKMITDVFPTIACAKKDLQLYQDIITCDRLMENWKVANIQYSYGQDAWVHSNEILADINVFLTPIVIRHGMMGDDTTTHFNPNSERQKTNSTGGITNGNIG